MQHETQENSTNNLHTSKYYNMVLFDIPTQFYLYIIQIKKEILRFEPTKKREKEKKRVTS